MAKKGAYHIGTSGWHYDHWIGRFYPEDITKKEFLAFYKDHFETVEINNSFYHLPTPKTFDQWRQASGKGFRFAVKGSRYITHMKKLKDPRKTLKKFLDAVRSLKSKLGPILFQLPPKWHINTERLGSFLKELPSKYQYAFEFRDKSWFNDDVYALLSDHNAAFCIYDMIGDTTPQVVTADFIYVRFHGPSQKYGGNYQKRQLKTWAKKIQDWTKDGKDVYCYFNNDLEGYAVKNAQALLEILNT